MSMQSMLKYFIVLLFLSFVSTESDEKWENMFVKRCENQLEKEISDVFDKCDSQASDTIKETVMSCAKENCNTDGKFDKLDVCCYAIKPNEMFSCFDDKVREIEERESKAKGVDKEELHKKNLHNAAKIMECYEEIED